MSTVLRHMLTGIIYSLVFALSLIGLLLFVFPIGELSLLWETELGNVPFLFWIAGIILISGTVFGMSVGWYWKQRIHRIERKLEALGKGQRLAADEDPYVELKGIQKRIEEVQNKIEQQTEFAQKLATERAEEREQGLQDIVVQERNRLA